METQNIPNKEVNSEIVLGLFDFAWEEMQILMFEVRMLKKGSWCARENPFIHQDDINVSLDFQAFAMDLVEERCNVFYENLLLLNKIVKGEQNLIPKLVELITDRRDYHCQKLLELIHQNTPNKIDLEDPSKTIERHMKKLAAKARKQEEGH